MRRRTRPGGPSSSTASANSATGSLEDQSYRVSGLNLVVACIVLWNTVYLERAVTALRGGGQEFPDDLLAHLSPLAWEHINLVGDYAWRSNAGIRGGGLRPLRLRPTTAVDP